VWKWILLSSRYSFPSVNFNFFFAPVRLLWFFLRAGSHWEWKRKVWDPNSPLHLIRGDSIMKPVMVAKMRKRMRLEIAECGINSIPTVSFLQGVFFPYIQKESGMGPWSPFFIHNFPLWLHDALHTKERKHLSRRPRNRIPISMEMRNGRVKGQGQWRKEVFTFSRTVDSTQSKSN